MFETYFLGCVFVRLNHVLVRFKCLLSCGHFLPHFVGKLDLVVAPKRYQVVVVGF